MSKGAPNEGAMARAEKSNALWLLQQFERPHHDWMDFGFIELYFLYPPVCGVLLYRSRPKMAKNHLTKRFKTTIRQKVFESCANSFFDDNDGLKLFRNILIPCSEKFAKHSSKSRRNISRKRNCTEKDFSSEIICSHLVGMAEGLKILGASKKLWT